MNIDRLKQQFFVNQRGDSFCYLNINDKHICPFCKKEMKTEKIETKVDFGSSEFVWNQICDCEESKINFNNIKKLIDNIEYNSHLIKSNEKNILNNLLEYIQEILLKNAEEEYNNIKQTIIEQTTGE